MDYHARCFSGCNGEIHWQLLREHLKGVSELAANYARIAKDEDFANRAGWAGLFHDLGKYTPEFQEMLHGQRPHGVEHSGHGAAYAFQLGYFDIALAISGHHAGLADPANIKHRAMQVQESLPEVLGRAKVELGKVIDNLNHKILPCQAPKDLNSFDVHVRMLFSCLVDADRTDAAGLAYESHHLYNPSVLLEKLLDNIAARAVRVQDGTVKRVRSEVLKDCLTAATWPERLMSLTAPTGSGKTLASLAFALKRATLMPERVKRIIVVIPYLSIIEQTAKVYRSAIGDEYILEHHCAVNNLEEEPEDSVDRYRDGGRVPAVENWDAPVVITTSVRFFESLFSNKPKDLRRLHNIANAVVILDEVQTLPRHYVNALLSMMKTLAEDWGVTFLFCTATQPAFEKGKESSDRDKRWPKDTVREVLQEPEALLKQLRRVRVLWPGKSVTRMTKCSMADIAEQMAQEERALCIVNVKRHALKIYETLKKCAGDRDDMPLHLSTRMCPQHRLDMLTAINERLAAPGKPCLVVSTQLVEAGVDLDFPVVYRAMGPLDAIAQAAGRCDREGTLTDKAGQAGGVLHLFEFDEDNIVPPGAYSDAVKITKMLAPLDIYDIMDMCRYFNAYYDHDLDQRDIQPLRKGLQFREVAANFRMIDNCTASILVSYNEEAVALIRQLEYQKCLTKELARQLQRYQVALFPQEKIQAYNNGAIYELYPDSGIFACERRFYDKDTGFHIDSDEPMIG